MPVLSKKQAAKGDSKAVLPNPLRWIDPTGQAIYIDTVDGPKTLSGFDSTNLPIQKTRDNRNYLGVRSLIEDGLGGTVTFDPHDDGTYDVLYTVKNAAGEIVEDKFENIGCYEQGCDIYGENGRTYIGVRAFAEKLGYGDVISYWNIEGQEETEVLIQPQMVNNAVKLIQEGNKIKITAYVSFSGSAANKVFAEDIQATYAMVAKAGIVSGWKGTYDATDYADFGVYKSIEVSVDIIDYHPESAVSTGQRYLPMIINDVEGRAYTSASVYDNSIPVMQPMTMYLFPYICYSDGTYSPYESSISGMMDFGKVAAHEFGHVLGLGDAYVDNMQLNYNDEVPADSMMSQNQKVTSNEIEMLIHAWRLNERQEFFAHSEPLSNGETLDRQKSSAVKTDIYPAHR